MWLFFDEAAGRETVPLQGGGQEVAQRVWKVSRLRPPRCQDTSLYIREVYFGRDFHREPPNRLFGAFGERAQYVGSRRPPEFEWDEHNEDKLLRNHNVSALEVEQCFVNPHTKRRHGDALLMLGSTNGGRMLFLVYEQKPNGVVRVYSAREMTNAERRTYRQHAP